MARVPSLRELRRACPANVAILPSAPARKVEQRYGLAFVAAKRQLVASQAVAFPFKWPGERAQERQAQSLDLRADVPPFDPNNAKHLRMWEAIWDIGNRELGSERD